MIPFDQSSENLLSILGAAYDIAGAVILAWGLIFVRARAMWRQAATGWGYSPTLLRVFCEQKADATTGLILLVLGFAIQGFAGWGYKTTNPVVLAIGGAALAVLIIIHLEARHWLVRGYFRKALRSAKKKDGDRQYTDAEIDARWSDTTPR